MRALKTFLVFILACLCCTPIYSQENDIVFEQITNESGRSLGFITGIVQDQTGFMWFATRSGLYRYNGYSYKLFKKNASDSLSLPHNNLAYLYADRNNNFWIRHLDELSAFKNEKRVYGFDSIIGKNFDLDVKIVQDKHNKYWIGPTTKGLLMYDANTHTKINYHCPPNTYTPEAWEKFESLLQNNKAIASITIPGNEMDTTVLFTITQKGYYLIASNGEIDNYGKYD
jgi:ligand-binding sensor domain-containing protein